VGARLPNHLVAITRIAEERAFGAITARARADFLAHLIATSVHMPQTRARRRAEPEQAVAVYGAVGQWPSLPGRSLLRSL